MTNHKADRVVNFLFKSLLSRYQNDLKILIKLVG